MPEYKPIVNAEEGDWDYWDEPLNDRRVRGTRVPCRIPVKCEIIPPMPEESECGEYLLFPDEETEK